MADVLTIGPYNMVLTDEQEARLKKHDLIFKCKSCSGWHPVEPTMALIAVLGCSGGEQETDDLLELLGEKLKELRQNDPNGQFMFAVRHTEEDGEEETKTAPRPHKPDEDKTDFTNILDWDD